jgi:hypothetical protein
MRISQELREAAGIANALRHDRGDTLWTLDQRTRVSQAYQILRDLLDEETPERT